MLSSVQHHVVIDSKGLVTHSCCRDRKDGQLDMRLLLEVVHGLLTTCHAGASVYAHCIERFTQLCLDAVQHRNVVCKDYHLATCIDTYVTHTRSLMSCFGADLLVLPFMHTASEAFPNFS